jgi:hypothetical protein
MAYRLRRLNPRPRPTDQENVSPPAIRAATPGGIHHGDLIFGLFQLHPSAACPCRIDVLAHTDLVDDEVDLLLQGIAARVLALLGKTVEFALQVSLKRL